MKKKNWWIGVCLAVLLTLLVVPVQLQTSAAEDDAAANALKGQYALSHTVKLYVPSTVNGNIPITDEAHQKFVDEALAQLSTWFGGATSVEGKGAWVDDKKTLIKEKVTIVYAYADKLDRNAIDQVVSYAKKMKKELGQSSIALEVDGKMYFIE
ncbi:hypothetical protein J31TS4_22080 [Paenibacillus sp. J31TS4]|uniref:DUF3574 domain-containing protein n=1 Tax=Paenibacillus sp. J31TS4 TaxID=2807195 RepID=UPI001B161B7D|nr:DUF3574 domain-containing protein [Paenibacillus sp. J31TS4]GIP38928.1 hypothetical protein J31TS4_22080 [Paenibacillus sp. J31TS4]